MIDILNRCGSLRKFIDTTTDMVTDGMTCFSICNYHEILFAVWAARRVAFLFSTLPCHACPDAIRTESIRRCYWMFEPALRMGNVHNEPESVNRCAVEHLCRCLYMWLGHLVRKYTYIKIYVCTHEHNYFESSVRLYSRRWSCKEKKWEHGISKHAYM